MLNGFNRNATIIGNEFAWVGSTCVASWGYSSTCLNKNCSLKLPWREGPDARGGEQPRGTRVLNNLFREMGIYQKQASAYFHAKSGLTEIAGNVVFNGPRAMFSETTHTALIRVLCWSPYSLNDGTNLTLCGLTTRLQRRPSWWRQRSRESAS